MTRKDYIAIAGALRTAHDINVIHGGDLVIDHVAYALCDVLAADNPRFNKDRFLDACKGG